MACRVPECSLFLCLSSGQARSSANLPLLITQCSAFVSMTSVFAVYGTTVYNPDLVGYRNRMTLLQAPHIPDFIHLPSRDPLWVRTAEMPPAAHAALTVWDLAEPDRRQRRLEVRPDPWVWVTGGTKEHRQRNSLVFIPGRGRLRLR